MSHINNLIGQAKAQRDSALDLVAKTEKMIADQKRVILLYHEKADHFGRAYDALVGLSQELDR